MRILVVNRVAHGGTGADRQAVAMTEELRARGHDVRILSSDGLPSDEHAIWNRHAMAAALDLLADFRPDVVHAHKLYPQLSVTPVVAAARTQTPVVQTAHDHEFAPRSRADDGARGMRGAARRQARRRLHVPRVDRWVAVSEHLARSYRERGIPATAIPYIAPSERPGHAADRTGVVFAGRLSHEKGVTHLAELARRVPEARISVLGDGPQRAWLEREAAGLDGRLEVVGTVPHSEVMDRIRRARVVVVPSMQPDPAGLVALEAMAVGTPVVAYAGGGTSEYVSAAGGGVVTELSADALADQVRRLLGPSHAWAQLSRRGREGIRAQFSAKRLAAGLEHVYGEAVDGRRGDQGGSLTRS
jgi:glycosyltransferase involved in cell wall biosynthesis